MSTTHTMDDFQVGDKLVFDLEGIVVHGTVESMQLAKKLVDVKIYEPGHRQHCLIIARPPETLHFVDDEDAPGSGPSSYADLQKRVEGDRLNKELLETIKGMAEHEDAQLKEIGPRIDDLASRVSAIEESLTKLAARLLVLETAAKPNGGAAASA